MTGFSKEVKALVRERATADIDNPHLVICEVMAACPGRVVPLYDLHHRRPRGMGGTKRAESNLAAGALAVCRDCHNLIESHRELAFSNGWLVKQHQTPSEIPVLYRHNWVLLDNDGNVTPASCVCGEIGADGWVPGPCSCVQEKS